MRFPRLLGIVVRLITLVFVTSPLCRALAQASAATSGPAFEVASVRMVPSATQEEVIKNAGTSPISRFPTNLFTAHRVTLQLLISMAYGIDGQNLLDMPNWLGEQTYDLEARVEGGQKLSYEQMKPLLQRLLKERFQLGTHWTTKPASGYGLFVTKNGPKLVKSKGPARSFGYIMPDSVNLRDVSMSSFASILSHPVGSPVVDKTEISGTYDIKMSFAPSNDPNSNLPDIFTAVQEQLGLKLEPQKVPVDFLVIDHVDRVPTEN